MMKEKLNYKNSWKKVKNKAKGPTALCTEVISFLFLDKGKQ